MLCVSTVFREQELSNLLMEKNYLKAIALAISLEQPLRVLNITKGANIRIWFIMQCVIFAVTLCLSEGKGKGKRQFV